jgi:hypothetical protein
MVRPLPGLCRLDADLGKVPGKERFHAGKEGLVMKNLSRLSIVLTVWIVCLIGRTTHTAPAQQFEKRVTIEVRSHTWRDAKPFDIAKNLTAKLRSARIQVVPRGAPEKDADILIEYNESKGGDYITPFNSFGNKFDTDINKRGQPTKVGQASPATVDKALGGKKEPAKATGDAPGGQEKEPGEDWRDMKKNFGVLTMVGKDKLGTDVRKWNKAIKNGYFRAVVEAVLNRFVVRGEFSKGQERILGQGMVEVSVLKDGDRVYLAQRIVIPGPPGERPRLDTYKFLLLEEPTTIESAVEKFMEQIRQDNIMLTRAEQAAATQLLP